MTRHLRLAVAAILLLTAAVPRARAPQTGGAVVHLRIDGEIEPMLAEFVTGAIDEANASAASLILMTMDTPGGLDTSMRAIIQRILESRAPVAILVTPSGARAASAGFFILLAADVAAMAPGTHTGAASPLAAIGGVPVQLDETMRRKILNDATAYLRSYVGRRGRNATVAETAVTEGKAFTEREALDARLIDLVTDSPTSLLAALDGRTITRFDGSTATLSLAHAPVRLVEMTARQRFLSRIVQPDVFFILLIVGVLGLYTEFTHPGLFAPGVIGGIALVLALFAMHLLPVNFAGLLLIALAVALFIVEAKFPTHGIVGVGGVVAMFLGALMVIRSPLTGAGVSLGVAIGVTAPFALVVIVLMRLVLRSRAWPMRGGIDDMRLQAGEVLEAIPGGADPGLVRVRGELWRAVSARALAPGARVRVVDADGLTLRVEPE